MKTKQLLTVIFVVILSVFAVHGYTAEKIAFSGTELFDPFNLLGQGPIGMFLDPGTVQCPGYEPTGIPLQPCPDGSRTHTRGTIWKSRFISANPAFGGWFTIEANANFDPDFTGPQWGTYTFVYDLGGEMTGSWQGVRVKEGDHWVSPLHATGRVNGGAFDGAQAIISNQVVGYTPVPIAYVGTVQGTMVRVP